LDKELKAQQNKDKIKVSVLVTEAEV